MNEIDVKKIIFGMIIVFIALVISIFGQPLIHDNKEAINIIVTVFSILARVNASKF